MNCEVLEKLVGIYGPSGKEFRVSEYIKEEIKDHVDEITMNPFGSVIARIKGDGPKVMIAGHMDQIGMMVTKVDKKGFIYVTNIGGINPYVTHGQRVVFEDGQVGIAYSKKKNKDMGKLKLEDIYIDVGARSKDEVNESINIGDVCVYQPDFMTTNNTITAGALDDRIGCFMMIEAIKNIENPMNDLYFVFTVQEEVGIRGAKTAAYEISPDIGIAVDITGCGDTPGADTFEVSLHEGAAIKIRDNSLLSHPGLNEKLFNICETEDINYQREVLTFGGTDAGGISLARAGVPSTCISIATRYAHSAHETISQEDLKGCIALLTAAVTSDLTL